MFSQGKRYRVLGALAQVECSSLVEKIVALSMVWNIRASSFMSVVEQAEKRDNYHSYDLVKRFNW
jgi:hypothetical protein